MSAFPIVTGVSPNEGHPGTKIIIRGENLGRNQQDLVSVLVNNDECVASAEWFSPTKITARCGRTQGGGDVIVITRSGGRGTCTVSFRVFTTRIGLTTEVGYWYDEAKQWEARRGRITFIGDSSTETLGVGGGSDAMMHRSSSVSASGAAAVVDDANPLGLDDPGEQVFGEEQLMQMFPGGSGGDLNYENFSPAWYILQHHSTASLRDLERALRLREEHKRRERETSTNDMVLYVKDFLASFFECVDTLDHLDARIGDDRRKLNDAIDGLNQMCTKMEQDIKGTFGEIFIRRRNISELKKVASIVSKYSYLWNTLSSINRARQNGNYALLISETRRLGILLEKVPAGVFKQILSTVSSDIQSLNRQLQEQLLSSASNASSSAPIIAAEEQIHLSNLLIELGATNYDPLWNCIKQLHASTIEQMRTFFANNIIYFCDAVNDGDTNIPQLPKTSLYIARKAYFHISQRQPTTNGVGGGVQNDNILPSSIFDNIIASFVSAEFSSTANTATVQPLLRTPAAGNDLVRKFTRLPAFIDQWQQTLFDLAAKRCAHMLQLWQRCNYRRAAADEFPQQQQQGNTSGVTEPSERFAMLIEAIVCQACLTLETMLRCVAENLRNCLNSVGDAEAATTPSNVRLKPRHLVVVLHGAQTAFEKLNSILSANAEQQQQQQTVTLFANALQHLRAFASGATSAVVYVVLKQAKDDAQLWCLTAFLSQQALSLLPRVYQILLHKLLHSLSLIITTSTTQPDSTPNETSKMLETIPITLRELMEMPLILVSVPFNTSLPENDAEQKSLLIILALIKLRYGIIPAALNALMETLPQSLDNIQAVQQRLFHLYDDKYLQISSQFVESTVQKLFIQDLRVQLQALASRYGSGVWSLETVNNQSSSLVSPAQEFYAAFLVGRILQCMNTITSIVDANNNNSGDGSGTETSVDDFDNDCMLRSRPVIDAFVHQYCQALAVSLATELNRHIRSAETFNKYQSAAALGCIYMVQNSLQCFLPDDGHFLLNSASEWVLECLERGAVQSNVNAEELKAQVVQLVKANVEKFFEKNQMLKHLSTVQTTTSTIPTTTQNNNSS